MSQKPQRIAPLVFFELGFFNLLALVLLPIFCLGLIFSQTHSPCGPLLEPDFYRGNPLRLGVIVCSLLFLCGLETLLLRYCLGTQEMGTIEFTSRQYLRWSVWHSLPLTLLLIAPMALPGAIVIYGILGLAGIVTLFGPEAIKNRFWHSHGNAYRLPNYRRWILFYLTALLLFLQTVQQFRIGVIECGKLQSVKANMYRFQALLDSPVGAKKIYPASLAELRTLLLRSNNGLKPDFFNPFTGQEGEFKAFAMMPAKVRGDWLNPIGMEVETQRFQDILGIRFYLPGTVRIQVSAAGLVLYERSSPTRYFIYGLDKQGGFIMDKGRAFVLSNS